MSLPRLPLYAQFLGWSLLNLVLLAGLLFALAGRDGLGLEMLLTDPARERAQGVGFALARQLDATSEDRWPGVLARFGVNWHATFELGSNPRRPRIAYGDVPSGEFVRIARVDGGYQVRIPLPLDVRDPEARRELLVTTDGLWPLLRFLGLAGWMGLLVGALGLSALWWWPFFHGITRRVQRLTRVTERIAEGRLTERAVPGRPDELASLARSVNQMGEQLDAKVEGQRRFLLDVAHELTSPLARMQLGLAIAQDELHPGDARRLAPVLDDAQQMSELLQDLLQFSRENRSHPAARVEPLAVAALVEAVCQREALGAEVAREVPAGLEVLADRALIERALANLVRNAVQHGGGAVAVQARRRGEVIELRVADRGPGVPDSALAHLGEPFYRADVARDRHTGGVGLGLAIVRRCVERCGGQVGFANRQGGGFEARVELPAAGSAGGSSPRE